MPLITLALAVPAAWSDATATGSATAAQEAAAATPSALPFDMPATSTLRASSRKVFAHYFPPFPLSLDNVDPANDYYQRNYLQPEGENGKFASIGGHLRDRPIGRPVRGAAWRVEDMQDEIRQAIAGGLDGFAVDLMAIPPSTNPQVVAVRSLIKAAETLDPGFKLMPMLDMAGNVPTLSQASIAAYLAEFAASPAAYRIDGKLVVSAFLAERVAPSWYTQLFSILQANHGVSVVFHPTFLDEPNNRAAFAPISAATGNWGNRNPAWNIPNCTFPHCAIPRIKAAQALNGGTMKFMAPVSIQDERPHTAIFDESQNTQNLRDTWQIARDGGAELVQMVTWNDYTEGTQFAPSRKDGHSWLDLNSYYLTWYKTGVAPPVVRDTVYLSHRTQPWAATPSYPQTSLMKLRGGSPARDTVEALTFLTAPATVNIAVGSTTHSCAAPAGQGVCTVPLALGAVSANVVRDGAVTARVTSSHKVTNTPYVQDLHYVAASSGRQGTSGSTVRLTDATPAGVPGSTTAGPVTPPTGTRAALPGQAAPRQASVVKRPAGTKLIRTLRLGSRGAQVKKLQKRLGVRQSGYFGKVTQRKVKAFQKRRGWRPAGVVGPGTWRALRL